MEYHKPRHIFWATMLPPTKVAPVPIIAKRLRYADGAGIYQMFFTK